MNKCVKCGNQLGSADINGICSQCRGHTFYSTSQIVMTPKEALEAIRKELQDRLEFPINLTLEYRLVKQSLNELEALNKTPTVDEVCKALSDYYEEQVSYSERHNHMFYFEKSRLGIVTLRDGNISFIQGDFHKTNNLPPYLITLIGRFYEGLEVKE